MEARVLDRWEIQALIEWAENGFERSVETTEEHVRNLEMACLDLIATVRDQERRIQFYQAGIDVMCANYDRLKAVFELAKKHNVIMREALKDIAKAEIPECGSCDSWAIELARETIAKVGDTKCISTEK
ncbi:MAG: hypothetical protein K6T83_20455 [Alicyclobacillus sp.]|nr:hypothetical protein [Alicyclobacillus sp.]